MNIYNDYIKEIEERKGQGLHPKPIDDAKLLSEIITQIKDLNNANREDSLQFFIYNTLPGTTSAAGEKAKFLKEIILGESVVNEITPAFAFELLAHMKGGPSIEVLLDLALGNDAARAGWPLCHLPVAKVSYPASRRTMGQVVTLFNCSEILNNDLPESIMARDGTQTAPWDPPMI